MANGSVQGVLAPFSGDLGFWLKEVGRDEYCRVMRSYYDALRAVTFRECGGDCTSSGFASAFGGVSECGGASGSIGGVAGEIRGFVGGDAKVDTSGQNKVFGDGCSGRADACGGAASFSFESHDDGLHGRQQYVNGFVIDDIPRGKHWASNRRKREQRKEKRSRLGSESKSFVPEWRRRAPGGAGYCETVVSETPCPSYGQALSDAEKEAKESLAKRRAAENAVAQKLAELKLQSLSDEKRCEQINDLKRQRLVEWTQVSAAKTQESLERLKAAGGIVVTDEQHAKVLRRNKDLEYEYDVLKERVKMAGHYDLLADLKAPGTATEAYEQAQAEMWAYGSVHSEPTGSDAAKIKERLEEFDRVYLETGQPPPFRPLDEDDDRPRDPVADIMRYRNRNNYGGPEFKW